MLLKITEKVIRENTFEQKRETWVKFNHGLSANRPSNNWVIVLCSHLMFLVFVPLHSEQLKNIPLREIEGHVLASFMNYSGMSSMEGESCKHNKICSTKKYVHKYETWVF